jgi:plasmid stability protein
VRNVPDELYARLRCRAEAAGRSLSAEIIVALERDLNRPEASVRELLDAIERRRQSDPLRVGGPSSLELLREDRAR